jgi:hypothetical protein
MTAVAHTAQWRFREADGPATPPHDGAGFADSIERVRRNFSVDGNVEKALDM